MKIEVIRGPEGSCISLNDFRIAGPKPWGGGRVVQSWDVEPEHILEALCGRPVHARAAAMFVLSGLMDGWTPERRDAAVEQVAEVLAVIARVGSAPVRLPGAVAVAEATLGAPLEELDLGTAEDVAADIERAEGLAAIEAEPPVFRDLGDIRVSRSAAEYLAEAYPDLFGGKDGEHGQE